MPNMSIMVDYDLMDENTADPMYLEYITQRKAYLHYTLLNHEAELAECHENNRKVEDAIQAHIGDLDNLEYYGDTKATAPFKMMLYRLEELKAVKVDFDRITDEVERLIKYLKTEVGELEVEVEYNEQLVDEAEARQMEEYDGENVLLMTFDKLANKIL
jgi:hypothetical protein